MGERVGVSAVRRIGVIGGKPPMVGSRSRVTGVARLKSVPACLCVAEAAFTGWRNRHRQ